MFRTLLAKEFREQLRTSRFVIMVVVLFISGLISPVLAKYTPALIRAVPNIPPALAAMIPDPTVNDAITQYVKNVGQFGLLLVVILTMGAIAQEKERGTAAMLLVKPVRRSAVVLTKWLVMMATILVGLAISGLGGLLYTLALFELLPIGPFVILNLLIAFFLGVYLSVALLASTLARTQSMAAGGAFGGLAVLLVLSSLPRVSEYMPSQLLTWGSEIVLGGETTPWAAIAISTAIIILSLVIACLWFEREEI
jgi:ABC-2 type transport system permease protein